MDTSKDSPSATRLLFPHPTCHVGHLSFVKQLFAEQMTYTFFTKLHMLGVLLEPWNCVHKSSFVHDAWLLVSAGRQTKGADADSLDKHHQTSATMMLRF